MRFRLALLAGLMPAALLAQFGADRAAPAAPLVAPHPWAVAPRHGDWMVCVKSYVGPNARAEAEQFAQFVRTKYNAAAFLYERGQEERLAQEKRRREIIAERRKEFQPFLTMQAQLKAQAEREGREFVAAPATFRVPEVTIRTQWAVLVGGWKDMDTAAGALRAIHQWKDLPPNELLDRATISGGDVQSQGQYLNPFASAMVCPNPSVQKAKSADIAIDPVVVKLNANEPLSVLKLKKPWTLIVKDYSVPMQTQTQGQEGTALGRALGLTDEGKYLAQTAADATKFAEMLRSELFQKSARKEAQKLGLTAVTLDSYVLHLQTGSRVTVGAFESLDDPALEQTQRMLSNMSFLVPDANGGRATERRIFNGITPMPVPKVN